MRRKKKTQVTADNHLKVLGICASPRAGGNCDILLDKALDGARSTHAKTEKIALGKLEFSPCLECDNMPDDGTCLINDDMQEVYEKLKQADIIIFAAPVFFGSLSAQAKMMIDRFQCLWRAKYILGRVENVKDKKGAFICVEASQRDDFLKNASSIVKNFFAVIGAKYKEELLCKGVDKKAGILNYPQALRKAFALGKKLSA